MQQLNPVVIGIIVISVLIMGGVILSFNLSQGPAIPQYKISDSEKPQMEIKETDFDFGKMKITETKTKEIPLQNKGVRPLIISSMITSCDCTFAQLVTGSQESPKFSMRGNTKWRGEIAPNQSAILKVIYSPSIMPVKGKVAREVSFKTNDPQKPLVNVVFSAEVGEQ